MQEIQISMQEDREIHLLVGRKAGEDTYGAYLTQSMLFTRHEFVHKVGST